MGIERVSGYPDYTFDGSNKNIPILFSGKTLEKLYDYTFLSEVTNTDYVGEVKNLGDKVYVRTVPNIVIRTYKKGQALTLEHPESSAVEFTVDKAKYFNFALDDIDLKQFDLAMMDKWASDAAEQMKIAIEEDFLDNIFSEADSNNYGTSAGRIAGDIDLGTSGSPKLLTKANILDFLIDAGQVLDEQNVPETDRYIILPSWATALIKKSDLKDASLTGDGESVLRNGRIGRIDRFVIYNSNLLHSQTDGNYTTYDVIFGHKMACQFVTQLTKVETYRPENTFADAMKGLNVYGYGCLQPVALGWAYIAKG